MDYDELEKGRRRNWESLKSEEERLKEREDARKKRFEEKEKQAKRGKLSPSLERLKRLGLDEEAEADRVRYKRTKKLGIVTLLVFFILFGLSFALEGFFRQQRIKTAEETMSDYETVLDTGEVVHDLSDPVGALATWRSAWLEGDMPKVVSMFSEVYMDRVSANKSQDRITAEYIKLYQGGSLGSISELAVNFKRPEIIRVPAKPWNHGQLALFRSPYLQRVDEEPPGKRYIVAFAWDSVDNQWRYADMREAEFFSIKWDYETEIPPKMNPRNAIRYDDEGDPVRE